jgi:hypothetical protein
VSVGKPKAKEPKCEEPSISESSVKEISRKRGVSEREVLEALGRVRRWCDDAASKPARVKRTVRRWEIYLRDQDWPYESSTGNGRGNGQGYTPPPGDFEKPEGTPVSELSEADLEQARKDTAAARAKLPGGTQEVTP